MKHFTLWIMIFLFACNSTKIRYSGLNDLVFCYQSIILYQNQTFLLDLGGGAVEGNYSQKGDTIFLTYKDALSFPSKVVMTQQHFIILPWKEGQNKIFIQKQHIRYDIL